MFNLHNHPLRSIRPAIAVVTMLMIFSTSQLGAATAISVRLNSGRVFEAEVAAPTNADRLWLAFRTRSAELLRPVAWSSVAVAEFDGQSYTGEQLRHRLLETPVAWASQAAEVDAPEIETLPTPSRTMADEASDILFAPVRPVASVQFDAHLANWNGDVQADGLLVQVIPVDADGQIVQARGHVEVELFTTRRISFNDGPQKQGRRVDRIGRWSEQVLPQRIDANGTWFKLPFQADHPELDTDLGQAGLVHVKLIVPGSGVFEASLDGVRVRPYAPLRDNLQRVEGRRFLSTERTGRN